MLTNRWAHLVVGVVVASMVLLGRVDHSVALQVGDKAPDFSLPATHGEQVRLADYLGKQPVVVFFYIGAFVDL